MVFSAQAVTLVKSHLARLKSVFNLVLRTVHELSFFHFFGNICSCQDWLLYLLYSMMCIKKVCNVSVSIRSFNLLRFCAILGAMDAQIQILCRLSAVLLVAPRGFQLIRWENLAPSATLLRDTSERRSPRQRAGGSRHCRVYGGSACCMNCDKRSSLQVITKSDSLFYLLSLQWQQTVPKPLVKQQQEEELRKLLAFVLEIFFSHFWAPHS